MGSGVAAPEVSASNRTGAATPRPAISDEILKNNNGNNDSLAGAAQAAPRPGCSVQASLGVREEKKQDWKQRGQQGEERREVLGD